MQTLAQIVVEHLIFFCRCEEEEMDPDSAVKLLEYACDSLDRCSELEKQAVLNIVMEMRQGAAQQGDTALVETLEEIRENLWQEEDEEDGS